MKKSLLILTAIFAMSITNVNAQIMQIYKGNTLIKEYDTSEADKVVFKEVPQSGDAVEETTTINGSTYTKAVGGTVADYVDLGIVVDGKKVLWATHNLGASKPEEYGAYIAWGENGTKEEGYVNGLKTSGYLWPMLKYCCDSYGGSFTKYVSINTYGTIDSKTTLESEDDAATVNWGNDWHTPTYAELTALKEKCTWTWYESNNTNYNGVAGYKVTGTNGNSIFLPATGYRYISSLMYAGTLGLYWSNSLYTDYPYDANELLLGSSNVNWNFGYRCNGQSIRPVRSE